MRSELAIAMPVQHRAASAESRYAAGGVNARPCAVDGFGRASHAVFSVDDTGIRVDLWRKRFFRTAAFAVAIALVACGSADKHGGGRGAPARDGADATGLFATFDGTPLDERSEAIIAGVAIDGTDAESVWALAQCDCMPRLAGTTLTRLAAKRGALPQILVPDVRAEIAGDERLKTLAKLPKGLASLLKGLLTSDDKIEGEVRESMQKKLAAALPGGTQLAARLPFRIDLFKPLGADAGDDGRSVDVAAQAARWSLVTALPGLWEGGEPVALGDHGLQLLHASTMLAEWKYAFGLESGAGQSGDGGHGGLVVRAASGIAGRPGRLDPRAERDVAAFLGGHYAVAFPADASAVDLATNAEEVWARRAEPLALAEQAMLLDAAARAFARLRPAARAPQASLYADGSGLFPANVHELPLAFLAVMGPLLKTSFVDADARAVHAFASLPATPDELRGEAASLTALARLARALAHWVDALERLDDAVPDAKKRDALLEGRDGLRKALQLSVQIVLRDHVAPQGQWLGLVEGPGGAPASLAESAETLATLAAVAAQGGELDSPFLRERIVALTHWLAATQLVDLAQSDSSPSPAALLWTATALAEVERALGDDAARIEWLPSARATLADALARLDEGSGP